MAKAKKVIVLGFDGSTVEYVRRYVARGKMPNHKKLIRQGTFMENCLCPYPTITPPNWTTIATGANIGTHGITCFWQHHDGDPLDQFRSGFDSRDNRAEYFWAAAGRAGKRSIVFNFPATWPPVKFPGIQIDGSALNVGDTSMLIRGQIFSSPAVAAPDRKIEGWLYQPKQSDRVSELRPAKGWKNLKARGKPLEMELSFDLDKPLGKNPKHPLFPPHSLKSPPARRYLIVDSTSGRKYDRVRLFAAKDGRKVLGEAKLPDMWSGWIKDEFELVDGPERVDYRLGILALDPKGKFARVYLTGMLISKGWSRPAGVAKELLREVGPHIPSTAWDFRHDDTGLQLEGMIHEWYGRAINYLADKYAWDAIFMHAHVIDFANHWWIDRAEPDSIDWPGDDRCEKLLCKAYEVTDRLLGQVMELVDDDTVLVVVSDHGCTTKSEFSHPFGNPHRAMGDILEDAGLLVWRKNKAGARTSINWKKSKAVCQRAGYVYVNLKGRDPEGIVEPDEEYEKVRTQVVNLFYDYTDPKTGKKPITFAVRKEHAMMFGLYGDRIGDIVYALEPEFEHAHGQELPTGKFGIGSEKSLLVMAGPGIKKNHVVERPTALQDIVPTLCHLTGFPVPRQAEGGVIYQALDEG